MAEVRERAGESERGGMAVLERDEGDREDESRGNVSALANKALNAVLFPPAKTEHRP